VLQDEDRFNQLIKDGASAPFKGWDFSWLRNRVHDPKPFWDYRDLVIAAMETTTSILDMGTGGGEFLASLAPFYKWEVGATESYAPNMPLARERLEPLDVTVYTMEHPTQLPIADNSYDLVINRHEEYDINEVKRVLKPNGFFLTQQVGGHNDRELLNQVGGKMDMADWTLDVEIASVTEAGFTIIKKAESYTYQRFWDVGAVVYYLRAIAWAVPDFSIESHRSDLIDIHNHIEQDGDYPSTSHRFLIEAHLPAG